MNTSRRALFLVRETHKKRFKMVLSIPLVGVCELSIFFTCHRYNNVGAEVQSPPPHIINDSPCFLCHCAHHTRVHIYLWQTALHTAPKSHIRPAYRCHIMHNAPAPFRRISIHNAGKQIDAIHMRCPNAFDPVSLSHFKFRTILK